MGGGGGGRSSRPWDKGRAWSKKKFFSALQASFWPKNKGSRPPAPPLDPPLQTLGASSHELSFRDLAFPLNPLYNYWCVHKRRRAGPVPEISVFPTGISVSGLKFLPYAEHFSPVTQMKAGWVLAARMSSSSCIACCVFHVISITFNSSDTA